MRKVQTGFTLIELLVVIAVIAVPLVCRRCSDTFTVLDAGSGEGYGAFFLAATAERVIGIARSGFYYEPVPETEQNLALMRQLDEWHLAYPVYGSRRLTALLRRAGFDASLASIS